MLRTTVRLPSELLEAAKVRARQTGRTLTQLLEHAVRAELALQPTASNVAEQSPTCSYPFGRHPIEFPAVQPSAGAGSIEDRLLAAVLDLQTFVVAQPDRDVRSDNAILGYDANGIPS